MEVHPYNDFSEAYAAYTARREEGGIEGDPILLDLLALLGDIEGRPVLDAGCGDGYLSRVLAARGARVVGMDIGPRLIEMATMPPEGYVFPRFTLLAFEKPAGT